MHDKFFLIFLALATLLAGCKDDAPRPEKKTIAPISKPAALLPGCRRCHAEVTLDQHHNQGCISCHRGDNTATEQQKAHTGLVAEPASPANMAKSCGTCHPKQIQGCAGSLHLSLEKAVNLTRHHFGATDTIDSLVAIPLQEKNPALALVDDMLRRRCLRCHLYSRGDDYPYITRGTGCAACHLQFSGGSLQSHRFLKSPGDWQCISCHYANHVGADYYGQFEHDFNWEYRTPYTSSEPYLRPYGVELHDLAPDIHQQKGLICIDCHNGKNLQADQQQIKRKISCLSCHAEPESWTRPPNIKGLEIDKGKPVFIDHSGHTHAVPMLRNPAHKKYSDRVSCQVCHAQWSFDDYGTYLMRSETDDFDMMERLTVQSSSWVEQLLDHNLNSDEDERDPTMPDTITGKIRPGIWYKGFGRRRWRPIIVRRDDDGVLKVFRPILDLHLSAVDSDGRVLFDDLTGNDDGLRPYTPHTTGPAGLFYLDRFKHLLERRGKNQP